MGDVYDLPIWSAAVRSEARFVVSHNLRDFPPRGSDGLCAYNGIEFVTVVTFVGEILKLNPDEVSPRPIPTSGRIAHPRRA